jgi:MFS family permease
MLDWSAVLITEQRDTGPAQAGFAFASFSMAMTLGRLIGDRVVAKMGRRPVVTIGALLAAAGIALATSVSVRAVALLGSALVGLGCSNIRLRSSLSQRSWLPWLPVAGSCEPWIAEF